MTSAAAFPLSDSLEEALKMSPSHANLAMPFSYVLSLNRQPPRSSASSNSFLPGIPQLPKPHGIPRSSTNSPQEVLTLLTPPTAFLPHLLSLSVAFAPPPAAPKKSSGVAQVVLPPWVLQVWWAINVKRPGTDAKCIATVRAPLPKVRLVSSLIHFWKFINIYLYANLMDLFVAIW